MKTIIRQAAMTAVTAALLVTSCQKTGQYDCPAETQEAKTATVSFLPTVLPSGTVTKGTLINDNDGGDPIEFDKTGEFYVSAWDMKGTSAVRSIPAAGGTSDFQKVRYFTTDLTPDDTDTEILRNSWNTVTPGNDNHVVEYMWLQGIEKAFFAYANTAAGSASPEITVDATTHLPVAMTLEYEEPSAVQNQKDLLVAYYRGEGISDGKPTGTASLGFTHALSSVSVRLGTLKGVNVFRINSISVEKLHAGGTMTMTPTGTGNGISISWAPYTGDDSEITLSQAVNMDITSGTEPGAVIGEPFIVIPQDFGSYPARMTVNVTADGRTFNIYWTLDSSEWAPGIHYSYAVDYNGHEGIQLWENGPYWAMKNVGASKPEEAGWYFSWGNVKGYVPVDVTNTSSVGMYNCRWVEALNPSVELSGGFTSASYGGQGSGAYLSTDIPVEDTNDAALAIDGTKWRIPTATELQQLCDNTDYIATTRNGVIGLRFKGRGAYSDRFIFLPCCGVGHGSCLRTDVSDEEINGKGAFYCSSTRYTPAGEGREIKSLKIYYETVVGGTDIITAEIYGNIKSNGCVIRPVENTLYAE